MKKMITGNRKLKRRRIIAAAGAGLTAAAVLITTVLSRPIDAQAADTLMGIERLRSNIKASGSEYVVLEVVPDGRTSEIGYLFDGYEPILSEWDEETGEWKDWREVLCEIETYEDRAEFINKKKKELQEYYDRAELTSSVPVVIEKESYAESSDGKPALGYEEITVSDYQRTGWFALSEDGTGSDSKDNDKKGTKYLVAFHYDGIQGNNTSFFDYENTQYYVVANVKEITKDIADEIADDTLIYYKVAGNETIFEYVNKWEVVKNDVTMFLDSLPVESFDTPDQDYMDDYTDADADTETDSDTVIDSDTDPDDPNADPDDPNADPDDPNTDPDDPNTDPDEPVTDPDEPGTDPDAPVTDPDAPVTDPDTPVNPDGSNNLMNSVGQDEADKKVSSAVQINFGRWFLLSGEVPEDTTGTTQPGDTTGTTQPGDTTGTTPSGGTTGTTPSGDTTETTQPEEPAQGFDKKPSFAAASNAQTDDQSDPSDENEFAEGYCIVKFKRVPGNIFPENSEEYSGKTLYSVIGNTIEASVNGDYVFEEPTSDNEGEVDGGNGEIDYSKVAVQTYKFPGRTIYCKNTFKTNEWFKHYVIDMDEETYEDFPVKVITLTPEQLNAMYQANNIPEFDFLYLSSGPEAAAGQEEDPDKDPEEDPKDSEKDPDNDNEDDDDDSDNEDDDSDSDDLEDDIAISTYIDEGNDLSPEVLQYLYATVIAGTKPCLVDGSILYARGEDITDGENGGTVVNEILQKTNIFRLAAMFCQEDFGGNYDGLNNDRLVEGIVDDADKCFVVEHVYCRYGNDSIINSLFSTPTIYAEGGDMSPGFQKVLDEILLENQYREADSSGNYGQLSTDISQATAIRHIINYADRRKVETKEHIRVLEIQPAKVENAWEWTDENGNTYTGNSELTMEQLKKWAPGVKSAEITVMTTAEFIGKIEKLNENYDLIYIGTSKDHLNMHYWVGDRNHTGLPYKGPVPTIPPAPGGVDIYEHMQNFANQFVKDNHIPAGTAFNDSDMDGLIYYNIGDLRGTSMQLAGMLNTEYVNNVRGNSMYYYNFMRYGGNDITEEKMKALLSFLDGSYPVIVADDFFESPVTLYEDAHYAGSRVNLPEGEFDHNALLLRGIADSQTSSIKIKEGYQATFHNGWYFDYDESSLGDPATHKHPRDKMTVTAGEDDLDDLSKKRFNQGYGTWDENISSIKVEKISDEVPARAIDEEHIDNCSYMYEFVKKAMDKKYVNFYAWSDITDDSELFKFYLNRPKVSMTQSSVNGYKKVGSDIYYVEAGANGRYNLEYHFTIHNEGAASFNSRYECKLYIDINSDGKFSPTTEEVGDIRITQGGGYVSWDNLYADREYVLRREIPAGYKGLLPWRVEITQADNPNIYTSISGYSKLDDVEQEKITVLQIARDRGDWEPKHNKDEMLDLGKEIETPGTIYNALVKGGTYDGVTYEGIEKDYDIDVTFKTISEYEREYDQNHDYLKDFNMLILGFDDMYSDIRVDNTEDGGPMGAIVDFINSGKSVLLSHDTTSYFQYTWGTTGYLRDGTDVTTFRNNQGGLETRYPDNPFAYTMNQYIRPLVGMDRYGVLTSDILKRGNTLSLGSGDFAEAVSSRYDKAYKPKSAQINEENEIVKTQLVPQVQGYTYIVLSGKDYDHNGGVNKGTFTGRELDMSQVDGETFTNKYRNIRYDEVFYRGNDTDSGDVEKFEEFGELSKEYNTYGEIDRLWVTRTNEGQITEYPYKLPPEFEIAETHGQYYQLDYTADDDGDGESDLVVWFCLGKKGENGDRETVYSQSPNDVRNNYYIYNKGNITYTGMGHSLSDISHERNPDYTLDEAKLFINTMIAAYQAGVRPPYVSALKKGVPESEELTTLYRFYDRTNDMHLDDLANKETYEKIYFTVRDVNFVKGTRTIATNVYYKVGKQDGSVPITVDGEEITVEPLQKPGDPETGRIYEVNNSDDDSVDAYAVNSPADPNNLRSGGIYYVMVPKSIIQQCEEGLDLYFEAQTTLTTNTAKENVYVTDKVYAKLQVLQAYMFNLE